MPMNPFFAGGAAWAGGAGADCVGLVCAVFVGHGKLFAARCGLPGDAGTGAVRD